MLDGVMLPDQAAHRPKESWFWGLRERRRNVVGLLERVTWARMLRSVIDAKERGSDIVAAAHPCTEERVHRDRDSRRPQRRGPPRDYPGATHSAHPPRAP